MQRKRKQRKKQRRGSESLRVRGLFLLVLCFIILAGVSSAVPPVQTTALLDTSDSLLIEYMQLETIKVNEPYEYHFHVYNQSNNFEITNKSVACEGHMYNTKGMKVLTLQAKEFIGSDGQVDGFFFNVSAGNFSNVGLFKYHVYCNDSIRGGFVTGQILVSTNNQNPTEAQAIVYIGMLVLTLILFLTAVFITFSIKSQNEMDFGGLVKVNFNKYLKYLMFYVSYLLLWLVIFFAWQISFNFLQTEFFTTLLRIIYVSMTILLAPMFLITFLFAMVKWLTDLKLHKLYERGLKPR